MKHKKKGYNARTLKMMDGYVADHQSGMTIPEIAQKYGLTTRIIHYRLPEIAELSGVSLEELYDKPALAGKRTERQKTEVIVVQETEKVTTAEVIEMCIEIAKNIEALKKQLEEYASLISSWEVATK